MSIFLPKLTGLSIYEEIAQKSCWVFFSSQYISWIWWQNQTQQWASHALVIKLVVLWQLLYIMINWNNSAFEHFGYHYQEIFICQVLVKQYNVNRAE